jgi:hypothetical protein
MIHTDFKQDFDIDLPDKLEWGALDYFFWHNDNIYYHKPALELSVLGDVKEIMAEMKKPERKELIKAMAVDIPGWQGSPCGQQSLAQIRRVISGAPKGMPKFVEETKHFFVFEFPTRRSIGIGDITVELLSQIENSFDFDFGPYYNNMAKGLYIDETGQVYWTLLNRWVHYNRARPLNYKLGIFIEHETDTHVNFFPHMVLDELHRKQVQWLSIWEYGNKPLTIHD